MPQTLQINVAETIIVFDTPIKTAVFVFTAVSVYVSAFVQAFKYIRSGLAPPIFATFEGGLCS